MIATELTKESRAQLLDDYDLTKAAALAALHDDDSEDWKTLVAEHLACWTQVVALDRPQKPTSYDSYRAAIECFVSVDGFKTLDVVEPDVRKFLQGGFQK